MADFYPGLSDSEAADLAANQYGSTSTGSSGGSLLSTLGQLAQVGASAYATANGKKPQPKSSNTLLYVGAAVVGLILLVLVIRK